MPRRAQGKTIKKATRSKVAFHGWFTKEEAPIMAAPTAVMSRTPSNSTVRLVR
jgi:hypothetical protein